MKFTDITLGDASVEAKVETLGVVLDKKLSEISSQVSTVSKLIGPIGPKGDKGDIGLQGIAGINGNHGKDGLSGRDGKDGKDGVDGSHGISVVNASVALDGALVLELSDGTEVDVGEVVGPAGAGGLNGAQGPMGLQGPQGEQGIQGTQGTQGVKGDTGEQGIQGIQGIQGVKGDTGDTGPQGLKGDKGDTGNTGAPGTSVNIKGEVATVGTLPSSGNSIGDAYIVTADGNLYTWTGSAWLDVGQIVGPQGATGATGATGPQGPKGDTGDTGPQGIQGIQGVKGDTGDTGATGATGAAGTNGTNGTNGVGVPVGGTTGQVLSKINATDYNTQWVTPASGGSITSTHAALTSDVQMPTSNTWYNGPSVSLDAGTWLVNTHTTFARTATTALTYFNRITDGTTHHSSGSQYMASVANHTANISLTAVIVLASTTTIKIQSTTNAGATSALMKAALLANGSGNNATKITAIKLA